VSTLFNEEAIETIRLRRFVWREFSDYIINVFLCERSFYSLKIMLLDQVVKIKVHLNLVGTTQSVFVLLPKKRTFALVIRNCSTLLCNQTSNCINHITLFCSSVEEFGVFISQFCPRDSIFFFQYSLTL
jgi:hypothetical protein